MFNNHIARIISAGANDRKVFAYVAMFGFDKFKAAFDKLKVHKTQ